MPDAPSHALQATLPAHHARASHPLTRPQSVGSRVLIAVLTVAGATGVVKVASMAKEVAIAATFGAGDQIDAVLIASVLPTFIIGIVAAAFQSGVVPTYIEVREREGPAMARELISAVALWTGAVLVALTGVLALSAPFLLRAVGSGFEPEKLALTRQLFYLQMPLVVLAGLTAVWGAAMNAEERFVLVAVAPIATPLLVFGLVLATVRSIGVFAVPAGMVLGAVVEGGVLAYAAWQRRLWVMPRLRRLHPAAGVVMRQAAAVAAGALLMNSAVVVDNAMAAMLPAGSVATLNYGNRLVLLLLGLSSGALSTALLPQFSALVARSDRAGLREILRSCIRWIVVLAIPSTAILIVLSEPLTRLVFERGAFTSDATLTVSRVQVLYLLQVPFYLTGMVMVRLISAFKANHLLMWGSAINLGVNVSLNYVFMRWIGVSGIALSTTVVYVVSCTFLALAAWRLMKRFGVAAVSPASHPPGGLRDGIRACG